MIRPASAAFSRDGSATPCRGRRISVKAPTNDRTTFPVAEEQVTIRKRQRVTETLQVHTVTHEHEQPLEAELSTQTLRIERVPCDRFVDHAIPDRQEGETTIISVVEEVATLSVRLKLVEEVRITRHTEIRRVDDAVKLRRQEIIVERGRSPPDTEV
nr:YsnF/AvaK domain-containing protein [Azospirillum baldaniorum]